MQSSDPEWLAGLELRRGAGYAKIMQAAVAETHKLGARARTTAPFNEGLFQIDPAQPVGAKGDRIQGQCSHGVLQDHGQLIQPPGRTRCDAQHKICVLGPHPVRTGVKGGFLPRWLLPQHSLELSSRSRLGRAGWGRSWRAAGRVEGRAVRQRR